ncbi:cysteine desulfurase [Ruminococcus sp. YE71]|uniref:cysteine desulfurase family protein n=1 Tax=unclassified Ruminococcus TaxID=2608920 RepID=UPI00088B4CA9|nr:MULTISPECIES: cysteine desulfurase family protein [unclassified Ruminococcus]SDA21753.1 cysteine desulfurase [Ruminococcus sp. YE78]SFW36832.1 cysteine desulfurase [Ruminococcus sp. YE71]
MSTIYLDYSADTPPDERVLSVYAQSARAFFANPNSAHSFGASAKQIVDNSLTKTAELLGVSSDELILTSGASEANNLAVKGIAWANRRRGKHIVSTFLEHSSVSGALTYLQEQGWEIDLVDILPNGKVDIEHLKRLLRTDTVLCAVCAVDSELGTVQPVAEIAEAVSIHPNCRLHVDMTQAVGKIPIDLTGVHTASFAPHKFYGLKGSGVLYKAKGTVVEPLIHGGASTTIYRSGTPDAPAAAALSTALELAFREREERFSRVKALNGRIRAHFEGNKKVTVNSPDDAVPHILNLSVSGIKGEEMRRLLDERGVCVSVKSACSVANTPSRAVMAVSRDRKRALTSWRISLSHLTTDAEVDRFLSVLDSVLNC